MLYSLMFADRFGDSPGNAKLFAYDSYGNYHSYSSSCDLDPVYATYCFDCHKGHNGDTLDVLVNGFNIPFYYDVRINNYLCVVSLFS